MDQQSLADFDVKLKDNMAACDFFTVEALTFFGLVRYHVFFVIHLSTRRVEIAGITSSPSGNYMAQVARNLTDCEDGFLNAKRFLIMDRDPLYTHQFRKILKSTGVRPVRLPAKSPNLNAYAERFVRTIKEECLSKIVPLGEKHLRKCISEFESYYHEERAPQAHRGSRELKKGGKTLCISCMRDEGRPFGVGFQERASNHSKLLRLRAVVVSVGVKASGMNPEQVWIRETNASEPLLTRRNVETCRQNQGRFFALGQACRIPGYWAGGGRRAEGVNLIRALVRNCGNQ